MTDLVQTSAAEHISVDAPARRVRRTARAQAATIGIVSMLIGIDGFLIPLVPTDQRLPAYLILFTLMAFGGIALGIFDLVVGRTLALVVGGASDLHRAVADRAAELAQLNAELRRRERQRSELFATMSHELRTPLNAILGFSRALLDGLDGSLNVEQRDDALQIHDAGRGLLGIVNGVLDLARLEAGAVTIDTEPLAVAPVVDDVLAMLSPLAAARRLTLTADLPADLPRVLADEDRLRISLVNLVGNAIKFTDDGGVTVRASYDEYTLSIDVGDTGIGIAPAAQDLIFQPFRQARQSDTRRHGGTGLGLAIVRETVQLMQGRVWVESEEGVGSIFHLALPIAPTPSSEPAGHTAAFEHNDVLVLGSGPEAQDLVSAVRRGGATATLATGETWRHALQYGDARLVLMDLQRPRAQAWRTLAELRSDAAWHGVRVGLFGTMRGRGRVVTPAALDLLLEPALNSQFGSRLDALLLDHAANPDGPVGPVVLASADPVWRGRMAVRCARQRQTAVEVASVERAIAAARERHAGGLVLDLLLPAPGVVGLLGQLDAAGMLGTLPVMLVGPASLTPSQQQALRLATNAWLQHDTAVVDDLGRQIRVALDRPGAVPAPVGKW